MGNISSSLHADRRLLIEGVELDPLIAAESLRRAARITRDDGYNYAPRSSRRAELLREALQLDAIASMFPQLVADAAHWQSHTGKKVVNSTSHSIDQNPIKREIP